MPCNFLSKLLRNLGIQPSSRRPSLVISQPFNFQSGPAVNFPGYSQDDISLMREKAIASTAVTEDGSDDDESYRTSRPRGLGRRVVWHARRVSRGVGVGAVRL